MDKPEHILLYSGGVDSYIAYYYLKEEKQLDVIPVYINLNHRYAGIELNYIRKFMPNTKILNFLEYGKFEDKSAYIPNRNLLFCLYASSYFEHSYSDLNIYLGGLKDDRIQDNNSNSFDLFSKCLTLSLQKNVSIKSAFDFKLTKAEIVHWYHDKININKLEDVTFSCYNPDDMFHNPHCYSCRACFRRNVALSDYVLLPFDYTLLQVYKRQMIKNPEEYDPIRYKQTMSYISKIERSN